MKPVCSIFIIIFISLLVVLPGNVYPETNKKENIFNTQNGEIKITAVSYELDMKNSIITFAGDVEIAGDDIDMSCQKLELSFKNTVKATSVESGKYSIENIVATESVVIKRPDRGYATAEKAEYLKDSEKIILTGNPHFKDGEGHGGSGYTIILDLKEERYIVEGTKEEKAKFSYPGKSER